MESTLAHTIQYLPTDRPRYLMGVGYPEDILMAVSYGVDMFDCVLPTRNARTGNVFTSTGQLTYRNADYAHDDRPLDPNCDWQSLSALTAGPTSGICTISPRLPAWCWRRTIPPISSSS